MKRITLSAVQQCLYASVFISPVLVAAPQTNLPSQALDHIPQSLLKEQLANLPEPARQKALDWLARFDYTEQDIPYLRADNDGGIFYHDQFEAIDSAQAGVIDDGVPDAADSYANVFSLHSHYGAPNVVYLDFNGHNISNTAWNNGTASTLVAKSYDLDGSPNSFSSAELANIAEIWRRMAEDYAPFNIDVTTEEPATFGPTVARVLITADVDANGYTMPAYGAGGVAYVGVFGLSYYDYYSPALVYYNRLGGGRADYVTEAASHEFGHNLNLSHDATSTAGYYGGHGTGDTSWGPIMGTGYNRNVSQWSNGNYPSATNFQDDLAIIGGYLGVMADDHPNHLSAESRLMSDASGVVTASDPKNDVNNELPDNKGVIDSDSDVDVFYFESSGGAVNLSVAGARQDRYTTGGNLDVAVKLYDSNGYLVASDNNSDVTTATLAATIAAGTYYLSVEGVGSANYNGYGSVGQYFISGSIPVAAQDTTAPEPSVMAWSVEPYATSRSQIAMQAVTAYDASGVVQYQFQCVAGQSCVTSGWQDSTSFVVDGLAPDTSLQYQVVARDAYGNMTAASPVVAVTTWSNTAPVANNDSASVTQGASVTINVLNNDSDADGDSLSLVSVESAVLGNVSISGNALVYDAQQVGSESFTYQVADSYGAVATGVVAVTVNAAVQQNQGPVAVDDSAAVTSSGGSVQIDVLANDSDPDGLHSDLRIVAVSAGSKGDVVSDGLTITYTHTDTAKRKFNGSDSFTYIIEDADGAQATATVSITFGSSDTSGGTGGSTKGGGKGGRK